MSSLTYPEPLPFKEEVEHGEVFTRRWVVELILDLAGYAVDRDLAKVKAVEPAAGSGAFVLPMLERLSESLRRHGRSLSDATTSLLAVELRLDNVERLQFEAAKLLTQLGWSTDESKKFVRKVIVQGDYLLMSHEEEAVDVLVGNPPYIRLEDLGPERLAKYQAVSAAMKGRADIYVGFFDVGMDTLAPEGRCVFICADRWMRNSYGKALRKKVVSGFAVDLVLPMHDADAFEDAVSAYPAITVIRRGKQGHAILAQATSEFGPYGAALLEVWTRKPEGPLEGPGISAALLDGWFDSSGLWPDASPQRIAWLEHLSETLPTIEGSGGLIRIGIATGLDAAYVVGPNDLPDIEPDRLLPLSTSEDIVSGRFAWGGRYLVNPWVDGAPVNLAEYPRLEAYLRTFPKVLERNVAQRSGAAWHRTIDPVRPWLANTPKLLMTDMSSTSNPVLDDGSSGCYPHHNLYSITSDVWDLRVLGGLLLSEVVEAQVAAYCVKMRGDTLRFQAQYLRMIRVPQPTDLPEEVKAALIRAFDLRDRSAATDAALEAYGLPGLPE